MVIYSFYLVKENKKERLRDHVALALDIIRRGKNSRLIRIGKSLNKNFYKLLEYSTVFHDFGKVVYNQYCFDIDRDLSFDGHEIISCWTANEYFQKLVDEEEIKGIDRRIMDLAILLHHHPMNLKERYERLRERREMKVNFMTFDLFYEELGEIVKRKSIVVNKDVGEVCEEVYGRGGLLGDLWREIWMNANSEIRKTFLLVTQALVAADNYSAHKIRGGDSKFIDVINMFIKFNMTPL